MGDEPEGAGLVLRRQGEEMVELMRRCCFYGQEREVGEGRVGVDVLPIGKERGGEGEVGVEEGARWLAGKLGEEEVGR